VNVQTTAPSRVPAHATAGADGIVVMTGPVTVELFIDFQCPFCRRFEQQHGAAVEAMASEGAIGLVYHPMNFLDAASTTRYSSRAASASGCASDRDRFLPYAHALFANQPPEGGPGLSNRQLAELGLLAGIEDPDFPACVDAAVYVEWATYVTERAAARGVQGTPTAFVDGVQVPADARAIAAAVAAVTT
jgi:protein-disulfide isomerase